MWIEKISSPLNFLVFNLIVTFRFSLFFGGGGPALSVDLSFPSLLSVCRSLREKRVWKKGRKRFYLSRYLNRFLPPPLITVFHDRLRNVLIQSYGWSCNTAEENCPQLVGTDFFNRWKAIIIFHRSILTQRSDFTYCHKDFLLTVSDSTPVVPDNF